MASSIEKWEPPPGVSFKAARPKPPNAGKGRKAGVPNKTTALLKDAILRAAEGAGGKAGPSHTVRIVFVEAKDGKFA